MAILAKDNVAREFRPTSVRERYPDGRLVSADGNNPVWLYKSIPLGLVQDAKTPLGKLAPGDPILAACEELARATPTRMKRRDMSRNHYREVHFLLVNIPVPFVPPREHENYVYLRTAFQEKVTRKRVLLMGVRLVGMRGSAPWREQARAIADTLLWGTNVRNFDHDAAQVNAALSRAGLRDLTEQEFRLAESWWNHGRSPDTPTLAHTNHAHFFTDADSAAVVRDIKPDECSVWGKGIRERLGLPDSSDPDDGVELLGQHALSFAAVREFDEFRNVPSTSGRAAWASQLLDRGAVAISVRGLIEPSQVTREELRRNKRRFLQDLHERAQSAAMERAEELEREQELSVMENAYSGEGAPPTLMDASVIVALDGVHANLDEETGDRSTAKLAPMNFFQLEAHAEMGLAYSAGSSNFLRHDLPVTALAFSGLPSLSRVGDEPVGSALLGYTERDQQPAWVSPLASSNEDSSPMFLVIGNTGAGKTLLLQWLTTQFTRSATKFGAHAGKKRPVVVIDFKVNSDLSDGLGDNVRTYSLDDITSADGLFDPLRYMHSPEAGAVLASDLILRVDPFGGQGAKFEVELLTAIRYGASEGATCVGQALQMALEAKKATREMVDPIMALRDGLPAFATMIGIDPDVQPIGVADGITYVRPGSADFTLPGPNDTHPTINQRANMVLLQSLSYGMTVAMHGRDGVLAVDEAWVLIQAGRAEVERLGRLARSLRVLPLFFTQRATDAIEAGLEGYISRGIILHMKAASEARAALQLFGIDREPLLHRITDALPFTGDAPNYHTLRPIVQTDTRQVYRGAVGIYCDLNGNAVPVDITLPDDFFLRSSTNAAEMDRRNRDDQRELLAQHDEALRQLELREESFNSA